MKKQIQKLIFIFFAFYATNSFAQTTSKEITDKFFEMYSKDPSKAVDYGFSTNKWVSRKQDAVTDLKKQTEKFD